MTDIPHLPTSARRGATPRITSARPAVARFYDAMLGGKDNYAVERALAGAAIEHVPQLPRIFRDNRVFAAQAARRMAERGITQFLDLGCGLPNAENIRSAVRAGAPEATVAYVDQDPAVIAHGHVFLADGALTAMVRADLRDPRAVLRESAAKGVLDPARPVGILLTAVLHHITCADDPAGVVREYLELVPRGSMIAISHFHAPRPGEPYADLAHELEDLLVERLGSGWFRSHAAISGFFDGLELQEGGVRPLGHDAASVLMLRGIARSP
ncbi:SAM-dependent methyltransferase [Actinomadura barringtoniae]|nr:SAM-dependent methyltransferase [Actinomadura barringtoniae]